MASFASSPCKRAANCSVSFAIASAIALTDPRFNKALVVRNAEGGFSASCCAFSVAVLSRFCQRPLYSRFPHLVPYPL